jgi:hypothetical protein
MSAPFADNLKANGASLFFICLEKNTFFHSLVFHDAKAQKNLRKKASSNILVDKKSS